MPVPPRVLYLASASIAEPLIISQVIRYLKRMQDVFETCHLVTLERKALSSQQQRAIAQELKESGIHWHVIESYQGRRALNIWREIVGGYRFACRLVTEHQLNLIHARSFVPGNIGLRASRKTGARFLYDMRGFWAEEKWAKGTIRRPWMRRLAQRMEDRLFHQADALISLTEAGRRRLIDRGIHAPIEVIPCCVDTDVFHWNGRERSEVRQIISVGSLGPGYLPEAVFGVFAAAQQKWPGVRLQLLTRTDREKVSQAARAAGCDLDRIDITSVPPEQVPSFVAQADLGLCMIQPSGAKIASSPTKLAEYFACGVPVIANCEGIGDMTEILTKNRVGSNLRSFDDAGYLQAVEDADSLLAEEGISRRCRELAETEFSVTVGTEKYAQVYQRLCGATS